MYDILKISRDIRYGVEEETDDQTPPIRQYTNALEEFSKGAQSTQSGNNAASVLRANQRGSSTAESGGEQSQQYIEIDLRARTRSRGDGPGAGTPRPQSREAGQPEDDSMDITGVNSQNRDAVDFFSALQEAEDDSTDSPAPPISQEDSFRITADKDMRSTKPGSDLGLDWFHGDDGLGSSNEGFMPPPEDQSRFGESDYSPGEGNFMPPSGDRDNFGMSGFGFGSSPGDRPIVEIVREFGDDFQSSQTDADVLSGVLSRSGFFGPGQGTIDRSGESLVKCDDPTFAGSGTFFGEGAPPSLLEDTAVLPEDFIFDQRGASEAIESELVELYFDPFDQNRNPWWSANTYNKNLIIPQQFYYNDYLSDSLFFRDPKEQEDPRYNFGSRATVLNDDFRYCCGGTWDHTSVVFGEPTTVYESAVKLDFEKGRIPDLPTPEFARQNRGLLFYHIDPVPSEIEGAPDPDNEGRQKFYKSGLDLYASRLYINRIFSNRLRRNVDYSEHANLLYNFIFRTTAQSLEDPTRDLFESPIGGLGNIPGIGTGIVITDPDIVTRTTTYYSKNFFDHTFQAPVGYSRSYTDFYPSLANLNDLVQITSHAPPGDLQIQNQSDLSSSHEFNRASFYRSLSGIFPFQFSTEPQQVESCTTDKIQKFPQEQVRLAQQMTNYLHSDSSIFDVEDQESSTFVREFYEMFDSYNSITFNMSRDSQISGWFEQTHLMTTFFEMLDELYPINSTFYTQVLDAWLNNSQQYLQRAEEDDTFRIDSDLAAVNLRPNEVPYPFEQMKRMLNGQAFLNRPQYEGRIDTYTYPLGFPVQNQYDEATPGDFNDFLKTKFLETPKDFWNNGEEDTFYDAINKYRDYNRSMHRSAFQIFEGSPSYSEVLAYRVEKTDTSSGEVVQNFFFANTPDIEEFTFLDTQVVPGKRYTYRIFTINFVVGSKYNYETNNLSYEKVNLIDPSQNEMRRYSDGTTSDELFGDFLKYAKIRIPMSIEPDIRLIEAPYFEREITTVSSDLPPLFPDVSVAESHRTTQSYLEPTMFMLSPQFGSSVEAPVPMRDQDLPVIQTMRENQESSYALLAENSINLSPDNLMFRSDTLPTHYEMFYSFRRPRGYADLYGSQMLTTTSDQPFFDLDVPLNKELFVTFRSRDLAGVSNPGPIYELIKHNYGDGTYFSFETLETYPLESNLTFENLLSIEPSIYQRSINLDPDHTTLFYTYDYNRRRQGNIGINWFDRIRDFIPSDQNNFIPYSTVPPAMDLINLGNTNVLNSDLIWNRKFKFRITSTISGNSFDLNTSFKYSKILLEPEEENNSIINERCYNFDSRDLDARRRRNSRNSDENLNTVGGTTYNETSFTEILAQDLPVNLTGIENAAAVAAAAQRGYDDAGESGLGRGNDETMRRAEEGIGEFTSDTSRSFGTTDRAAGAQVLQTGAVGTMVRNLGRGIRSRGRGTSGY